MKTDSIIHEPASEYHARGRSGEFMTSHLLADFRESPVLYYKEINGEIEQTESTAFLIGRAAHSLILEGREGFDRDFIVSDGPINPKTGELFGRFTKAYGEWRGRLDRDVISGKDYGLISRLHMSVLSHPIAGELLLDGVAEGVIRAEYCGVPCQIRMDWFSPKRGLVDLKTCEALKWFEMGRYGYIYQMAFYRGVIREVTGVTVPVHIIAVEKNEPFSTGVWKLTEEVLDRAEAINREALARYRQCRQSGSWPTGYEELRIINDL